MRPSLPWPIASKAVEQRAHVLEHLFRLDQLHATLSSAGEAHPGALERVFGLVGG